MMHPLPNLEKRGCPGLHRPMRCQPCPALQKIGKKVLPQVSLHLAHITILQGNPRQWVAGFIIFAPKWKSSVLQERDRNEYSSWQQRQMWPQSTWYKRSQFRVWRFSLLNWVTGVKPCAASILLYEYVAWTRPEYSTISSTRPVHFLRLCLSDWWWLPEKPICLNTWKPLNKDDNAIQSDTCCWFNFTKAVLSWQRQWELWMVWAGRE